MNQEPASTRRGLRVLIADDQAVFRAGVRQALEPKGLVVTAEAADAESAIAGAIREQPDICLIDLFMPGDGMNAIAQIARLVPRTLVIALTVSDRPADIRDAIARGASGYLLKGISADELATAVQEAYQGRAAFSSAVVPQLVEALNRGSRRRLAVPGGTVALSAREWDVAELMRDGLPTKAIAARLGLSPITARKHVASVVKKLDASDRATAVQMLRAFGS